MNSRKESIEFFKKYLLDSIENKQKDICAELNRIYSLSLKEDIYLSCYCSPKPCHADIIKEVIESKIKPKETQFKLF